MYKLGNTVVLSKQEFDNIRDKSYKDAEELYREYKKQLVKDLNEQYEEKLENREDTIKNQKKTIKQLNQSVLDLEETVKVFKSDRDEVRDMVKKGIELGDLAATLDAKKQAQDRQDALLKEREAKLVSKEEGRYKEGYADGVADGVRKVSEITAKDRENAMKIAMVAASSHTPVDNMKEAMNVSRQLTAGPTDSEAK